MAKTKEKEKPVESKPGPGKKACPQCGTVVGTRTQKCPGKDCDYVWAKEVKKAMTAGGDFSAMIEIHKQMNAFIAECGGLDEALEWIDQTEAMKAIYGGAANLKQQLVAASRIVIREVPE